MSEQETWEVKAASYGMFNVVVMFDDPVSGRRLEKRHVTSSYLTKSDAELIVRLHDAAVDAGAVRVAALLTRNAKAERLLAGLVEFFDVGGNGEGWTLAEFLDPARDFLADSAR